MTLLLNISYQAAGAHAAGHRRAVHFQVEHAGGDGAGDGCGQRRGDPGARVAQDVGHLQHAGAQALADQAADAVFTVAHKGEADHLGAAACHGSTACQAGQAQGRADGRAGDRQRQRHADQHGNDNAHQQRLQFGRPHDDVAHRTGDSADGRGAQGAQADADQNRDRRGDEDVDLGLFADELADLGRNDGDEVDGQRAACAAQFIGCAADGNQAEQHQLRCVQCVTDGCGHCRACDCCRVTARRDQKCQAQLLAQRLDDGADQQAGKQALRHRAHRVDAVTMRRNDDVLTFKKRTYCLHNYFSSFHLLNFCTMVKVIIIQPSLNCNSNRKNGRQ